RRSARAVCLGRRVQRLLSRGGVVVDVVSSKELLLKARAGDAVALDHLFHRYRSSLQRWAHGRLPRWARDIADTDDLLQETLTQTLKQLPRIEISEEDALHAYLRQAVL